MNWFNCPVCDQSNAPHSNRCSACAADFSDSDVMAMMGQDASDLPSLDVAAGSLDHGKFLGVSKSGLEDGSAVKKLALFGAAMLAAAFLIPVAPEFGESMPAWKAMDHAPSIPLLFPVLAALMGMAAAFAPLESWQRSVTLVLAGLIGLGTLAFLGPLSGSPAKFMPVLILGCVVSAWGLILRSFDSQSDIARRVLVGGAVLTVLGFLIPMSDAQDAVPMELQFFLREEIGSAMPLSAFTTVLNKDPMVFFSSVYLLMPLLLFPLAAAVSWSKPKEAWDKRSGLIRFIAWIAVLYAPLGFALFTFNLMGYEGTMVIIDNQVIDWDDFQGVALTGRFRLTLLSAAFAAWATLPIVAVAKHFASGAEAPAENQ
jgi:hypothetical protein